jgi:hypothetical protein
MPALKRQGTQKQQQQQQQQFRSSKRQCLTKGLLRSCGSADVSHTSIVPDQNEWPEEDPCVAVTAQSGKVHAKPSTANCPLIDDCPLPPTTSLRPACPESLQATTPSPVSSAPHVASRVSLGPDQSGIKAKGKRAAGMTESIEPPKELTNEWRPWTMKLTAALECFVDERTRPSFQQWHQ